MEKENIITFIVEAGTEVQLEIIEETMINGVNYLLAVDV